MFSRIGGKIHKNYFHKKDFHLLRTEKFPRKTYFFKTVTKIISSEKEFLVYSEKRKLPRKKAINTKKF